MRFIGVNGIGSHGNKSTDLILQHLAARGKDTLDFDYPKLSYCAATCRKKQKTLGRLLAREAKRGDVVIAHSFGCLIALRAMECGAQFSSVIFLSAAMSSEFVFPVHGMERLLNIHNPADAALKIANLFKWGGMGDMGSLGYNGVPDSRITNSAWLNIKGVSFNHNHYFEGNNPEFIANKILKFTKRSR